MTSSLRKQPDQPVNVNFRVEEVQALDELCAMQEMSRQNVLRSALRVYQTLVLKRRAGYEVAFLDAEGRPEPTPSMLPMVDDAN